MRKSAAPYCSEHRPEQGQRVSARDERSGRLDASAIAGELHECEVCGRIGADVARYRDPRLQQRQKSLLEAGAIAQRASLKGAAHIYEYAIAASKRHVAQLANALEESREYANCRTILWNRQREECQPG